MTKLADIAPRLAKARDQREEEMRIEDWNADAYRYLDRAPLLNHPLLEPTPSEAALRKMLGLS